MATVPRAPIRFTPELETIADDEAETQREIAETMRGIIEQTHNDYGHGFRSVHAKSHALLEGTLEVLPNLPPKLAQGLFAQPGRYTALIRISTNPGDPLPDSISVPRGFAVKAIGVEGERLPGSEGDTTQDFVLATGPAFSAPDPKGFLKNLKLLAATTDRAEWGKKLISAVLRGTNKALGAVGAQSTTLASLGGYPNTHPLGETYYSQVPFRYGDHLAKIAVAPKSSSFLALEGQEIDIRGREDAIREEIGEVLANEGGAWELRVQLCTDPETMPIEDASAAWDEEESPYIAVATITVPPQTSWSYDRAQSIDDETSFSPWHGLAAHRPLGGVNRARKPVYAASAELRGKLNGCPIHEPTA